MPEQTVGCNHIKESLDEVSQGSISIDKNISIGESSKTKAQTEFPFKKVDSIPSTTQISVKSKPPNIALMVTQSLTDTNKSTKPPTLKLYPEATEKRFLDKLNNEPFFEIAVDSIMTRVYYPKAPKPNYKRKINNKVMIDFLRKRFT